MKIEITLFDNAGKPLGKAIEDAQSRKVQFIPLDADQPLPTLWLSVEACREAILQQVREVSK